MALAEWLDCWAVRVRHLAPGIARGVAVRSSGVVDFLFSSLGHSRRNTKFIYVDF